MYDAHLKLVELREKAFAARSKAARAVVSPRAAPQRPAPFDRHAAELERHASAMEQAMQVLAGRPAAIEAGPRMEVPWRRSTPTQYSRRL